MAINGVSDLSSALMMRVTVAKLQKEMATVQVQASTGRIADRGLALGLNSRLSVDLNQQILRIDSIKTLNASVSARLDATQTTLDSIGKIVTDFMDTLVRAKAPGVDMKLVQQTAADALKSLNGQLNTSFNGQYLFAGVNTDVLPVATDPNAATAPGKIAVDASFLSAFGMTQTDPAVSSLTASSVTTFLDGPFKTMFDDTGWRGNFSSASDKVVRSRISMSEVVDGSVSADAEPFRQLTMAMTMVAQLGSGGMNDAAASALIDKALTTLGAGQQGVIDLQARMGNLQTQVNNATDRLDIQSQSLAKNVGELENVDPYEMSVRYNSLSTQIETAYALTSRIKQLGLLKYL